MIPSSKRRPQEGYTLVETLVAMSVFLSVAIPLGVTFGRFLLSDDSERAARAIVSAEAELTRIIAEEDFVSGRKEFDSGLVIEREVTEEKDILHIKVRVVSTRMRTKSLVEFSKDVLRYQ